MTPDEVEYAFTCPRCEEALVVNGPMRGALIEKGCVICGAAVTGADFSPEQPVDH